MLGLVNSKISGIWFKKIQNMIDKILKYWEVRSKHTHTMDTIVLPWENCKHFHFLVDLELQENLSLIYYKFYPLAA